MSPLTAAMLHLLHIDPGGPSAITAVRLWRQAGSPDLPPQDDAPTLGAWLRRCREVAGYSQRDVAGHIDRTQMQVCRWETGEACPDAGELATLFDVYQLSGSEREEGLELARRHHRARARRSA